ncbi:hypothetical protein M406DRAFT_71682 [Cryphonectria parasitica EP155]|uniref:Uncharacterized protein n=1 Tax=Cryphonectria parasitica (strain ATCC 38755 / EP155) TaxID=660469 RepID=A0A9P4Y8Z0_CRYP1|nr:uncharacterized protein M406DRAFT_71682 [Cryphonectria parasitica EP155]KAF3768698.1 hypothetical protein M406DRAFT_71682 [Cryphonectria parasitica EP155]
MSFPLPIRLAASRHEEPSTTPETPPTHGDADLTTAPHPLAAAAEHGLISVVPSSELKFEAAAGPSNHQFWLKDAKIAEDLFTIHRSAKHLVEFTTSIIGNHDPSISHRPIPVMSDGDVLFMTQLSNDIARSVGGISAVRHHGMRTKKRKIGNGNGNDLHFAKDYSHHRSHHRQSRGDTAKDDRTSGSKRIQRRKLKGG